MTLQKALLLVLLWCETRLHDILVDPTKLWNERDDNIRSLAHTFASLALQNADILRLIQTTPEL